MPEGPSIVILKELLIPFKGKKILEVRGNAKVDIQSMAGKKIRDFRSWGKHFIISLDKLNIRIHFLLFGSYSVDEQTKPDKSLRLGLYFKKGSLFFYTCSVRILDEEPDEIYDWEADVLNDKWNPVKARKKIKARPDMLACDALLDQQIFAGVGNIIKNEVLYRIRLHPETKIKNIPPRKLGEMIRETRNYSFDFLTWKKAFVLKKHWLAHTKRTCARCDLPLTKKYCGKTKRRTFFCKTCQIKYIR
jgi:endonuclease-8